MDIDLITFTFHFAGILLYYYSKYQQLQVARKQKTARWIFPWLFSPSESDSEIVLKYLLYCGLAELLSYSDSFHFAEYVLRKLFYSNTGAGWFACEVFLIHSVECCEICHISKEACISGAKA